MRIRWYFFLYAGIANGIMKDAQSARRQDNTGNLELKP